MCNCPTLHRELIFFLCLVMRFLKIGISHASLHHSWKLLMRDQLDSSCLTMLSISLNFPTSPSFWVSRFVPCNVSEKSWKKLTDTCISLSVLVNFLRAPFA